MAEGSLVTEVSALSLSHRWRPVFPHNITTEENGLCVRIISGAENIKNNNKKYSYKIEKGESKDQAPEKNSSKHILDISLGGGAADNALDSQAYLDIKDRLALHWQPLTRWD